MSKTPAPTLADLAANFGVSATHRSAANDNSRPKPGSDPAPSIKVLAEVMAALPNGDHYDYAEWTRIMHMGKGSSIGTTFENEARELFLDWSAQYGASDPARDLKMWESIHSPELGWNSLRLTLYRTNRPAYDAINSRLARTAFAHLNGSVADVLGPMPDWVKELNLHHATVKSINGVLYFDPAAVGDAPFDVMGYTQFYAEYNNQKVDDGGKHERGAGTAWMQHPQRRSYSALGMWLPGTEPFGVLNLFDGLPLPRGPAPAGASCALIVDFFRKVVASGRPYVSEYLFDWFAWKVQHPLEKPGTNVILFGGQGTGKTTVGRLLLSIFGRKYSLHLTSEHQLLNHFNGHMEGKLFVLADESVFGKNRAQAGLYKALTTEDTMTIEHKGLTARQVANRMAFIFCSNSPTAVPVEGGDRRASVVRIEKRPGVDTAYFARLWDQWSNFGREAFMEFLLARDVSTFDPRVPLDTPEKLTMASSTADSFTLYWLERLANPVPFIKDWDKHGVFIATPVLEQDYLEWCRRLQHRAMTSAEIQVRLDALCPESQRIRQSTGARARGRTFPSADRCLELAEQTLGGSAPPDPSTS